MIFIESSLLIITESILDSFEFLREKECSIREDLWFEHSQMSATGLLLSNWRQDNTFWSSLWRCRKWKKRRVCNADFSMKTNRYRSMISHVRFINCAIRKCFTYTHTYARAHVQLLRLTIVHMAKYRRYSVKLYMSIPYFTFT